MLIWVLLLSVSQVQQNVDSEGAAVALGALAEFVYALFCLFYVENNAWLFQSF